jgi:hypothetical protein
MPFFFISALNILAYQKDMIQEWFDKEKCFCDEKVIHRKKCVLVS